MRREAGRILVRAAKVAREAHRILEASGTMSTTRMRVQQLIEELRVIGESMGRASELEIPVVGAVDEPIHDRSTPIDGMDT